MLRTSGGMMFGYTPSREDLWRQKLRAAGFVVVEIPVTLEPGPAPQAATARPR